MLEVLEERGSPTAIALPAQGEFAPNHLAQLDSLRSHDGETRTTADRDSVTDSATLRLVSLASQPKTEDTPTRSTPPAEPTSFLYSFRSRGESTPDEFARSLPPRHAPLTNPQRPQGTNNNLAGAGAGAPGVSTPNAVGGGGGASGGGGGGNTTNANQFLSALASSGTAVANTPMTPAPAMTAAATPMVQPAGTTTTPQATSPALDDPAQGSSLISSTFGGGQAGASQAPSGPLYVLDMNTGETLPANVTLNSFSTWAENLQAQVAGVTVSSYAWNLTQAPDLTNVSGQNTANLQGTWKSFTGPAHTDTLSVTETPTVGSPVTQTMTFQVAGTDSPAYSASRPTSSTTWPGAVTPDQVTTDQATADGGPYASLGMTDGSVQTSFSMPSYNPGVAPVGLVYSSTAANNQPIFLVHYQLPVGQAVPSTITAQLTLNNGTPGPLVYYNTSGLNPGDWMQIALQANATSLSTGRYPWSVTVTNGSTPTTYSGNVDLVNQASSPFGAGWSLSDVERLVPVTGGVILVNPDGTSLFFASNGSGGYITPAGDFSTLSLSGGVYTRTMPDGTKINFNSSGLQTSLVDRDGNTTSFGYNGSNQLTTITDFNNLVTTLTYSSGKLTSIEDPALRTATLGYTGNQLTSIIDPGSNLWQYSYDAANDLTKLTDPRTNPTTFTYNFADRVSGVTRADTTTEQLTAVQMNGLAAPGTGTSTNPAAAVLLATGDEALYTDPRSNVWVTGLDWLGFGLAVAGIDPLGDVGLTYRDANGLPWMSSDPLARRTREFFNSGGDPTKVVQPDDSYFQYQYNGFSEVTQSTDPLGNVTTNTYNAKGDLTNVTDALLHVTTYTYNSQGFVTSVTDPLNHTTTLGYDSRDRLTTLTNALSQTTTIAYNSASDVTSETDARGFTSTFAHNTMGWLTGETLADTSTTSSVYTFGYDSVGNQTSITDPLLHTTTSSYDKLNRLTTVTDALNEITTYGYDANGNQTSVTNPLNQTTTLGYDAANRLTSETNALSQTTTYGYDAASEQITETNALNQTTTFGYTVLGQLASVTNPLSDALSYGYNSAGENTSVSQGGPGNLTLTASMTYNAIGELIGYNDPLGNHTTYNYDAAGNLISVTDPLTHTTSYGYNAINQQTSVTDALNHTVTYGYDADGNPTTVTDPLLRTTTSVYDAQGRLLSVTDPRNGTTTYGYDLAGNQTSLTDPDNNTTSFGYDNVNRLTSMTDPLNHSTTYAYNAAGEMTAMTDRDGRQTTFGYDAAGRPTGQTWVGGSYTATYTYNAAGELTKAQDTFSTYSYGYDTSGQLTSVDNLGTPGVPHVVLTYGYDAYGDRTSLADSLGDTVSFVYDNDLRLTSIGLSSTQSHTLLAQVTFGYDAASRQTSVTRSKPGADTITSVLGYDNADRLANITHTDTTKALTLANYTYGYDAANQLTSYQDSNSSLTYGYDNDGELTSASGTLNGSSYSVSYSFDANGNRNMTGYTTGTGNELTSDGTYSYTYDNEGNMVSQTNIATGYVTLYSYDYRNRLTEVKAEDNHGTVLNDEKFTYDVNDNRIGVSLNGTQQSYTVYNGANPYMDFNGSGTLTQRYLTDPRGLNQFYARVSSSGTVNWYLTDNLSSVRQIISSSGTVLDKLTYDPFGSIVSETNAANGDRFKFAGGAYDSITGSDQFGERPYRPSDGRFGEQDPIKFAAGDTNLYRYVFNRPTYLSDPSGLILDPVCADKCFKEYQKDYMEAQKEKDPDIRRQREVEAWNDYQNCLDKCRDDYKPPPILPLPEPDAITGKEIDWQLVRGGVNGSLVAANLIVGGMIVATVFPGVGWVLGGAAAGIGGLMIASSPAYAGGAGPNSHDARPSFSLITYNLSRGGYIYRDSDGVVHTRTVT